MLHRSQPTPAPQSRSVTPQELTHDALATSLSTALGGRAFGHRVTWENMEFVEEGNYKRCRPDVFSITPTLKVANCRPWVCEVKVKRGDFLSDVRAGKWKLYRRFACRVYFAAPVGLIKAGELPAGAGLFEYRRADGVWTLVHQGTYNKDWYLGERDLMKMILGRWGTFQGALARKEGREKHELRYNQD